MARKAREISKSGNYYITLKGNELFVTDEDKKMFVEILEKNFATGIVHGLSLIHISTFQLPNPQGLNIGAISFPKVPIMLYSLSAVKCK